jgi:hypothetical protein
MKNEKPKLGTSYVDEKGRLRPRAPMPIIIATNPGGVGQDWVRKRFIEERNAGNIKLLGGDWRDLKDE